MKTLLCILLSLISQLSFAASGHIDKLTILLDGLPKPDHAPLLIAKELGYFKAANLDVEFISHQDPALAGKMIADRKADIGIMDEPYFIGQVDHDLPIIRIGTLIDKPLDSLVVLSNSNIHTIKDLKGKRIARSKSTIDNVMLKAMLRYHGLTDNDVHMINVKTNQTEALLTHKVDAANSMLRNYDVPQIEVKHPAPVTFLPEENGIPTYSVMIFVTNLNQIRDPRYPRFLEAVKKAVAWLDEHPQQGWELYAKKYPHSNNAVNREAWFATIPYFAEEPSEFDEKDWRKFADFMHDNKMIHKQLPTSRYAVVVN